MIVHAAGIVLAAKKTKRQKLREEGYSPRAATRLAKKKSNKKKK